MTDHLEPHSEPHTVFANWEKLAAITGLQPLIDSDIAAKIIPVKVNSLLKWMNREGFPRRYRHIGRHRPRRVRLLSVLEIRQARLHFVKGDAAFLTGRE